MTFSSVQDAATTAVDSNKKLKPSRSTRKKFVGMIRVQGSARKVYEGLQNRIERQQFVYFLATHAPHFWYQIDPVIAENMQRINPDHLRLCQAAQSRKRTNSRK